MVRADIHLALAISHTIFSSPACAKAAAKLVVAASKTTLFLCFHRTQAPRIRAFKPFRAAPVTATLLFLHQSKKEVSCGCGEIPCRLILPKNVNQNCLVNTQEIKR
jgi:hypothetical protein